MAEVNECRVEVSTGIDTENRKPGKRSVTLLSIERWRTVCEELGADLPWHIRRANFLVEGLELASTIGHPIMIGDVRVWIHGETNPCQLMDDQVHGLREALKPDFRGGVFGQVLTDGSIRVGDVVRIAKERQPEVRRSSDQP